MVACYNASKLNLLFLVMTTEQRERIIEELEKRGVVRTADFKYEKRKSYYIYRYTSCCEQCYYYSVQLLSSLEDCLKHIEEYHLDHIDNWEEYYDT